MVRVGGFEYHCIVSTFFVLPLKCFFVYATMDTYIVIHVVVSVMVNRDATHSLVPHANNSRRRMIAQGHSSSYL